MDSYFKGRTKTQRFHVAVPTKKTSTKENAGANTNAPDEDETIVQAVAEPSVRDAPQVDLVLRDGAVRRIVIHLEDGRKLELDCVYEDEK